MDNINLPNQSEDNTKTEAAKENIRVESSKQDDDKKTYKNSYMQHNSSDLLALDDFSVRHVVDLQSLKAVSDDPKVLKE